MKKKKLKIIMLGFAHYVDDGRVTFRESVALKNAGYRVRIIGRARGACLPGACKPYGIAALALQPLKRTNMLVRFIMEYIERFKFFVICWKYTKWADVLHCHEYQSLTIGLILAKLRGQKVIYDCHEFQPELFAEMFGAEKTLRYKVICWLSSKIEKFQAKRCSGIVTVNSFLVERFSKYNNNVCNLPNYPSVRLAEEKDADLEFLDELKNIIKNKFVIGFVGNLSNDRGVDNLIKAFACLLKNRDDVVLLLVGESSELELYKKMAEEYNVSKNVFFTGSFKYNELATYLRLIDLGVYVPIVTSYIEYACATKIFQYCAFGIPVVTNSTKAHKRLLEAVEFADVVEDNNVQTLADKLENLVNDRSRLCYLGNNAKIGFNKYWNAEVVLKEFIEFYSHI